MTKATRSVRDAEADRGGEWQLPALVGATALALAAILVAGRDFTYYNLDELMFWERGGWSRDWMFEPFLAQLIVLTRIVFQVALDLGDGDYTVVREIGAVCAVVPGALFFFVARPRVGATAALAMSIALLFMGTAWEYSLWPYQSMSIGLSLSFGLVALLLLERDDRLGDALACLALALSVASFGIGIAFLVAIAVGVLIRADRWRRLWIVALPLALYVAWWIWRVHFQDGQVELKSVPLVVPYIARSLISTLAGLAGLSFDFESGPGFDVAPVADPVWGVALAAAALAALAVRLRRGSVPAGLWVAVALLGTYWITGALVIGDLPNFRTAGSPRYLFPSAVMLMLIAAWALDGWRPNKRVAVGMFVVVGLAMFGNLAQARSGAVYLNAYSDNARAQLAMLELARDRVNPEFNPAHDAKGSASILLVVGAGGYLAGVDRYGHSPAYTIDELSGRSEEVRHGADDVLVKALALRPTAPRGHAASAGCWTVRPNRDGVPTPFELPVAGVVLDGPQPATVHVRRFADRTFVEVGDTLAGTRSELRLYPDAAARPWVGAVESAGPVRVCPARS